MIPRTQIRALTQEQTLADALRVFREVPHARFPVCDQSLDRITGIVAIKELLTVMAESSGQTLEDVRRRRVSEFARPPFVVPDSKSLAELLKEFKRTRQQMAIVIDEYGGTAGLITIEDVLEQIVGEIEDEYDFDELEDNVLREKGGIDYRCPAEPLAVYTKRKGGRAENAEGRRCLCNALLSAAGMPQRRKGGYVEPPIITSGDDFTTVLTLARAAGGSDFYSAMDVIEYLRSGLQPSR